METNENVMVEELINTEATEPVELEVLETTNEAIEVATNEKHSAVGVTAGVLTVIGGTAVALLGRKAVQKIKAKKAEMAKTKDNVDNEEEPAVRVLTLRERITGKIRYDSEEEG